MRATAQGRGQSRRHSGPGSATCSKIRSPGLGAIKSVGHLLQSSPLTPARTPALSPLGERFFLKEISRFEPLNLIESHWSVVRRSVAALPFGASRSSGLPAGEIGSGRRHTFCLATPWVGCSRWGGLSFCRRPGTWRLASALTHNHL